MLKFKKIKGNFVHPTAVINWKSLVIGKGNTIGPYVVIGNQAQWKNKKNSGKIIIGNRNVFNEYTNIHLPTTLKKKTYIGKLFKNLENLRNISLRLLNVIFLIVRINIQCNNSLL